MPLENQDPSGGLGELGRIDIRLGSWRAKKMILGNWDASFNFLIFGSRSKIVIGNMVAKSSDMLPSRGTAIDKRFSITPTDGPESKTMK